MEDFSIDILGSRWEVMFRSEEDDSYLKGNDGYTDGSIRRIVVDIMKPSEASKKDLESYKKSVIRHEIIHAFLMESGLDGSGCEARHWELNEEMVDWFAIQSPKIFAVFMEVGVL